MIRKSLLLALAAVLLAGGLGACGKRGTLQAPEGEAGRYTYPHGYPNPATVTPRQEPEARPRALEAPGGAGDLSPFPKSRTTTTYGQPPIQ